MVHVLRFFLRCPLVFQIEPVSHEDHRSHHHKTSWFAAAPSRRPRAPTLNTSVSWDGNGLAYPRIGYVSDRFQTSPSSPPCTEYLSQSLFSPMQSPCQHHVRCTGSHVGCTVEVSCRIFCGVSCRIMHSLET